MLRYVMGNDGIAVAEGLHQRWMCSSYFRCLDIDAGVGLQGMIVIAKAVAEEPNAVVSCSSNLADVLLCIRCVPHQYEREVRFDSAVRIDEQPRVVLGLHPADVEEISIRFEAESSKSFGLVPSLICRRPVRDAASLSAPGLLIECLDDVRVGDDLHWHTRR